LEDLVSVVSGYDLCSNRQLRQPELFVPLSAVRILLVAVNKQVATIVAMDGEIVSEEVLFNGLLTPNLLAEYWSAKTIDEQENILCSLFESSIVIFPSTNLIYNYDAERVLFIPLLKLSKTNLRSTLCRFIGTELSRYEIIYRGADWEKFKERYPKHIKGLQTGSIFSGSKIDNYITKLSKNYILNQDSSGIHFSNGRFDLPTATFTPREDPGVKGHYITKFIEYDFVTDDLTLTLTLFFFGHL
jgi:hypothetical protein